MPTVGGSDVGEPATESKAWCCCGGTPASCAAASLKARKRRSWKRNAAMAAYCSRDKYSRASWFAVILASPNGPAPEYIVLRYIPELVRPREVVRSQNQCRVGCGSPGSWSGPKVSFRVSSGGLQGRRQSEFLGRSPPQRGVRTALVVGPPPRLDLAPRVGQRQEPVRVQALVAQAAVERLDQCVVGRLARAREVQRDTVLVGPAVEGFRDELRPDVHPNRAWCSAQQCQAADDSHDLLAFDALVDLDRQSLARERIDDRQGPQPAAVEQRVGDEVHRPTLVRPECRRLTLTVCRADVPARPLELQAEALIPVEAVDPFMVHPPALSAQQ